MLSLILRIIKSGISHFYYFIYTVYASCLQFCLSLCLGKGKHTHNSHLFSLFSAASSPQPWENATVPSHCKQGRNCSSSLKKNNP